MDNKLKLESVDSEAKIELAAELAADIWRECYSEILEKEQIEYMLSTFQSAKSIKKSIDEEDYKYYILLWDDVPAGYSAVQFKDSKCFLSKLYIKQEFRHKKIASQAIEFFKEMALSDGVEYMWLTCNKHNERAVKAYEKRGFKITDTQEADIGNGYIMDDYIMEKSLS